MIFLTQIFFELEIVFDDAVVDDDDPARTVAMRMGVLFSGSTVGGPARVADAIGPVERFLASARRIFSW